MLVPNAVAEHGRVYREEVLHFFGSSVIEGELSSQKLLFVLFTNRCGSNFFCDVLSSTGAMNVGGEFFNAPTIIDVCSNENIDSLPMYINFLGCHFNSPPCLVSKLAIEQLVLFSEVGLLAKLLTCSHFVMLERRDIISQAVSRVIAEQNRQWISGDSKQIPDEMLVYSYHEIQRQAEEITTINRNLTLFLDINKVFYSRIFYEDFLCAPESHLRHLGQQLSLENLVWNQSRMRTRRQLSPIKSAWHHRYLIDLERNV